MRTRNHAGLMRKRARKSPLTVAAAIAALTAACGTTPSTAKAGGTGGSGNSATTYSVSVAYYPGALASLPAFIAADEGFFAKNHLKVDLVPVKSGAAMTSALVSGSVDFVNNSYDNLEEAVSKGLKVRAVVGNLVKPPFQLVARKGLSLPHQPDGYPKNLGDLLHKKWGIIQVGVSEQYIDEALLAGAGYDPKAVTYVGVGLPATALPALLHGGVDTYLSLAPMTSILLTKHQGTVVVDFEAGQGPAAFKNVNYNGWWATTKKIAGDPAAVRNFVRANEQAYCWYRDPANLGQVTTIMQKYVKVPQLTAAQYTQMIKENLPAYGVDINSASIDSWTHLLSGNHILSTSLSRDALVASAAPSSYTCP